MKSNGLVLFLCYSQQVITPAADVAIAPPPTASLPDTKVYPTLAIVVVCLLTAFFVICVVSAYFRHYAERQLRLAASTTNGSETGSMRSVVHGLDPTVIATFATFLYSSVKGIKIGHTVLECAVCLNEFQDHETLRLLPNCSHVFHRDCIDMWLVSHVTCPVCRGDLVMRPGEISHVTESLNCPVEPEIDYASTEFLLPNESSEHHIPFTIEMPRSHSTGHSVLVLPVEDVDRFTLRLTNEARGLFVNPVMSLPTSPHDLEFPFESSQKMAGQSTNVCSTRRPDHFELSNPERLLSRGRSSSSHVTNAGNDLTMVPNSQHFFRSVRSPFDRIFQGSNRNFNAGRPSNGVN